MDKKSERWHEWFGSNMAGPFTRGWRVGIDESASSATKPMDSYFTKHWG
jgi:hypothetical protein